MSVLSDEPFVLAGMDQWFLIDITLEGFTPHDYFDWCRFHELCHAWDYSNDEARSLFYKELLKALTSIYSSGPFDALWLRSFNSIFVRELAECWELDMGSMHVVTKQRYCRSFSMNGHGCYPAEITVTGTLLPGSRTQEEKKCIIKFEPMFDHIDDWVRLNINAGKNGYIIAGPQ